MVDNAEVWSIRSLFINVFIPLYSINFFCSISISVLHHANGAIGCMNELEVSILSNSLKAAALLSENFAECTSNVSSRHLHAASLVCPPRTRYIQRIERPIVSYKVIWEKRRTAKPRSWWTDRSNRNLSWCISLLSQLGFSFRTKAMKDFLKTFLFDLWLIVGYH